MLFVTLATAVVAASPLDRAPDSNGCLTAPLELKWTDLITMGDTAKRVARPECQVRLDAYGRFGGRTMQPQLAGRWRLGNFKLAGETVGSGFDMMWGTEAAFNGPVDGYRGMTPDMEQVILVPRLYLPEPWQRAVDTATVPVLVIGGAAITTWVIIEMLKSAR